MSIHKSKERCRLSWNAAIRFGLDHPLNEDEKKALRIALEGPLSRPVGRPRLSPKKASEPVPR